jgi:hypothetical protein
MKRRNFIKAAGALSMLPATSMASSFNSMNEAMAKKEIYEWRIYTLTSDGELLDTFLKEALIPAYQRHKVKTGAFKLYKIKDGEKDQRHVLFIYPNIETYLKVKKAIWDDKQFLTAAKPFFDTSAPNPVYSAFESYLTEAFDKIPVHRKPDPSRGLFEIRIYHSPNEEANKRKVRMFNVDEIAVFDEVKINSVLFGDILSGPNMPALLYLTWYKDETTRSAAWNQFQKHPEWKRISGLPEYAYTATKNQSIFLTPLSFSEI